MKIRLVTVLMLALFSQIVLAEGHSKSVERFVQAFNERDVSTMLDLSAEDMRWMNVSGQEIATETSTHEELSKAMTGYFQSADGIKSKLRSINESGAFVYALEEAFWSANGVKKSQCSMAVYEFKNSKIQHVWYFPGHSC